MIHVISASNRHLYRDVLEQHFQIRHQIFVEERGWNTLRRPDGREIDDYDNDDTVYLLALEDRRVVGGHRLYPTTKPTMMGEVFPHLAAVKGHPSDPRIWEWSRYFIVPDRREGSLNLRLMAAVQEFCIDEGITHVSAIMETWWLPRFQEAGFVVRPLGLPALVENAWTMAALIEINEETLQAVAYRIGQASVLQRQGPQRDHVAYSRQFHGAKDLPQKAQMLS
ncbi:MAG TPA: acyl-homoserine-lactone synthase [Rhodopseudomonas sp.]|uniref:acyl-homoserine-lactone synthase n=1 Tax=Rhodopseudomonas sp. TaxID=1078 RepID=UPI002ED8E66E